MDEKISSLAGEPVAQKCGTFALNLLVAVPMLSRRPLNSVNIDLTPLARFCAPVQTVTDGAMYSDTQNSLTINFSY